MKSNKSTIKNSEIKNQTIKKIYLYSTYFQKCAIKIKNLKYLKKNAVDKEDGDKDEQLND
jgi:hypothetical protein